MSIRRKLTFLLLIMTLVPLAVSRFASMIVVNESSRRLANEMRNELVDSATNGLLTATKEFSQLLDAKEASIRLMVRFQAEKIEKLLTDVALAQENGTKEGQQIVRRQLESITEDYDELRKMSQDVVQRQYVIFESGLSLSYPPEPLPKGWDPRQTPLYQKMKKSKADEIVYSPPVIDKKNGQTVTVVALPIFNPDGSFAGITGLDQITNHLLQGLELPERSWKSQTISMLVKRLGPNSEAPGEIAVLAKQLGSEVGGLPAEIKELHTEREQVKERPLRLRYLKTSNQKLIQEIADQAEAGVADIKQMRFDGKESILAYGPAQAGKKAQEPFLIVIVPKDKVTEKANQTEDEIGRTIRNEFIITDIIFIVLVILVTFIGIRSAKVVTRPVNEVTEAAIRLSEGDFYAHVEIHTKDELQRLAEVFNETGPKLLERENMMHSLAMASEIQQQLLPQEPPVCEGLDVAGQSDYCDETGGDYFDYLLLPGDDEDSPRLGVAIGDVSGHGIGAALIMASVRSVLRSHAGEYQGRLEELMVLLNRSLTDEADTGRFVTFCFSLFDPKQRTLRWVSAGHDPALYLHRNAKTDGKKGTGSLLCEASSGPFRQKAPGTFFSAKAGEWVIDELPNSGLPLGVMDDPDYEVMGPLEFEAGDLVLFGTDGIWETADPEGNAFGKERLRQMLLDMHEQSADAIREAIVKAVTTFRGDGPQLDDVTLVVVKVC